MKSSDDKEVKTRVSVKDNDVVKPLLQEINRAKTASKNDLEIKSDIEKLIKMHVNIIYNKSNNRDKDTEDFLIYLFDNGDIDWNTMIQKKILIKYAIDNGYIDLLDALLQSMQNRKIDIKSGQYSPIDYFNFESLGGQPFAVFELLTKKYKFESNVDRWYGSSDRQDQNINFWPMNNCTLLQFLAVKGKYDQVLRLLVEFKADPNIKTSLPFFSSANTLENKRGAGETALTKMILTVMKCSFEDGYWMKKKFTKDLVQNYCNIVKALAAFGLNLTDTDTVYLRIAEGHKKDESGKEYSNQNIILGANSYLLKSINPDAQKLRANIFTHMMRAYHEGRQIQKEEVLERTQQDIFTPKVPYNAQEIRNDDSKSNDADKIPNLSNIHTLFMSFSPIVNIINEYDQTLKYNLEKELQKDAKNGGEPSLYSDDDKENQNNLRG